MGKCPECGSSNIDNFVRTSCMNCGLSTKRFYLGKTEREIEASKRAWLKGEFIYTDEINITYKQFEFLKSCEGKEPVGMEAIDAAIDFLEDYENGRDASTSKAVVALKMLREFQRGKVCVDRDKLPNLDDCIDGYNRAVENGSIDTWLRIWTKDFVNIIQLIQSAKEQSKEQCKHTNCPESYIAWHNWAEKKAKTHKQVKCPVCGKYAIWEKNK